MKEESLKLLKREEILSRSGIIIFLVISGLSVLFNIDFQIYAGFMGYIFSFTHYAFVRNIQFLESNQKYRTSLFEWVSIFFENNTFYE